MHETFFWFDATFVFYSQTVPTVSFSVLMDSSINQTVGSSSTRGYICMPLIPNGEVTTSGQLVISGRLDVSDRGTYRCTSSEINGSIVIELEAVGELLTLTLFLYLLTVCPPAQNPHQWALGLWHVMGGPLQVLTALIVN